MKTFELDEEKLKADWNIARVDRLRYVTQSELAEMMGVSQSKVSRLTAAMNDDSKVDLETLRVDDFLRICDVIKRTPFEYFDR